MLHANGKVPTASDLFITPIRTGMYQQLLNVEHNAMQTSIGTQQVLGYSGLIPFVACLYLVQFSGQTLILDPQPGFVIYSAIILSFLAGTLWRKTSVPAHSALQITSNIFCLFACLCLFLPLYYALLLLPLGYLGLLLAEYHLDMKRDSSFTQAYFNLRLILTLTVCSLHALAVMLWF